MSLVLLAATILQFLAGAFDPNENSPDADDLRYAKILEASVRKMEEQGEVVVTTTGNLTRTRHFHSAALFDVLRAHDPAPAEYLEGLRSRRYVAIFVGVPDEFLCKSPACRELSDATLRNYFVAARLHERKKTGMVGYEEHPRFILRPRHTPLDGMDRGGLERRIRTEAGIVDARRWAYGADAAPVPEDDIEEIAAKQPL